MTVNPWHDSDEEAAREARDRASEWPEPPMTLDDLREIESEEDAERREEAENGPAL